MVLGGIALAVIAYMIIGLIWYSPLLFGNVWSKHTKLIMRSGGKDSQVNKMYALSAFGAVLTALVLNYVMVELEVKSVQESLALGFAFWIGFVFPSIMVNNLFQGRSKIVTFIDSGYQLASILAMSAIVFYFM